MGDERTDEQQAKFDAIPTERTFCVVKLYLTADNRITGMVQYDGHRLKEMGVPIPLGIECRNVAMLAGQYIQHALNEAGELTSLGQLLGKVFTGGEDDSKDGNNTGTEQSAATTSAS